MYLGSKERLLPVIMAIVTALPIRRAADLFAGALHVAMAMKRAGLWVHANDSTAYSAACAPAIIGTDARTFDHALLERILDHLNGVEPTPGYIHATFCHDPAFFSPANGAKSDAIRAEIDRLAPPEPERAIILAALIMALDRVNSTSGTYQADIKKKPPASSRHSCCACRPSLLVPARGARWMRICSRRRCVTSTSPISTRHTHSIHFTLPTIRSSRWC
jgi:adenine-specific DNA-methyltransferase